MPEPELHITLREFERVIFEERRYWSALRKEDEKRLEEYKASLARALSLQAAEYERRLEDLRKLESRVDIQFADRDGELKGRTAMSNILGSVAILISVVAIAVTFVR